MNCPLDPTLLADYWLGALPGAEEQAAEDHLFSCDPCTARLEEVAELAAALRHIALEGTLRMVVPEAFLHRAAQEGLRIRQYAPPAGGTVQCTVAAEDDLLIARLAADLSSVSRLDLSLCDPAGQQFLRLEDVPFHPGSPELIYQESITHAKSLPDTQMLVRLLSISPQGHEQLLGEYHFHHTRSLP
jgi:hypothetical protein